MSNSEILLLRNKLAEYENAVSNLNKSVKFKDKKILRRDETIESLRIKVRELSKELYAPDPQVARLKEKVEKLTQDKKDLYRSIEANNGVKRALMSSLKHYRGRSKDARQEALEAEKISNRLEAIKAYRDNLQAVASLSVMRDGEIGNISLSTVLQDLEILLKE